MSTEGGRFPTSVEIALPKGVRVELAGGTARVRGPLGEVHRRYPAEALGLELAEGTLRVRLRIPPNRRAAKALLHTWERHLQNLVAGVTVGFEAKLKSVAAHFPMKLQVKDRELLIENFLGEKHPRSAPILAGVTAAVEGEFVLLRGADIEQVGQCAATIERATHIRDYDPRVFQDGIYIVERAHPREAA